MKIREIQAAALLGDTVFAETQKGKFTGVFTGISVDSVRIQVQGVQHEFRPEEVEYFYRTTFLKRGKREFNDFQQALIELDRERLSAYAQENKKELGYLGYSPSETKRICAELQNMDRVTERRKIIKPDMGKKAREDLGVIFWPEMRDNLYCIAQRLKRVENRNEAPELFCYFCLEDENGSDEATRGNAMALLLNNIYPHYKSIGIDRKNELRYLEQKYPKLYQKAQTQISQEKGLENLYESGRYREILSYSKEGASEKLSGKSKKLYVMALLKCHMEERAIHVWLEERLYEQKNPLFINEFFQSVKYIFPAVFLGAWGDGIAKIELFSAIVKTASKCEKNNFQSIALMIAEQYCAYAEACGSDAERQEIKALTYERMYQQLKSESPEEDVYFTRLWALVSYSREYPQASLDIEKVNHCEQLWRGYRELLRRRYCANMVGELLSRFQHEYAAYEEFLSFAAGADWSACVEKKRNVPYLQFKLESDDEAERFVLREAADNAERLYFLFRKMVLHPTRAVEFLEQMAEALEEAAENSLEEQDSGLTPIVKKTIKCPSPYYAAARCREVLADKDYGYESMAALYQSYQRILYKDEKENRAFWQKKAFGCTQRILARPLNKTNALKELSYLQFYKTKDKFLIPYLAEDLRVGGTEFFEYLKLFRKNYEKFGDFRFSKFSSELTRDLASHLRVHFSEESGYIVKIYKEFFQVMGELQYEKERWDYYQNIINALKDRNYNAVILFVKDKKGKDPAIRKLEDLSFRLRKGETWIRDFASDYRLKERILSSAGTERQQHVYLMRNLVEALFGEKGNSRLVKYDEILYELYLEQGEIEKAEICIKRVIQNEKWEKKVVSALPLYAELLFSKGEVLSETDFEKLRGWLDQLSLGQYWKEIWMTRCRCLYELRRNGSPAVGALTAMLKNGTVTARVIAEFFSRYADQELLYDSEVVQYLHSFQMHLYRGLLLFSMSDEWQRMGLRRRKFQKTYDYAEPVFPYPKELYPDLENYLTLCQTGYLEGFFEDKTNLEYLDELYHFLQKLFGDNEKNGARAILLNFFDAQRFSAYSGEEVFLALYEQTENQNFRIDAADRNAEIGEYDRAGKLYEEEVKSREQSYQSVTDDLYWEVKRKRLAMEYLRTEGLLELETLGYFEEDVICALWYIRKKHLKSWESLHGRLYIPKERQLYEYLDFYGQQSVLLKEESSKNQPYSEKRAVNRYRNRMSDQLIQKLSSEALKALRESSYFEILLYQWNASSDDRLEARQEYIEQITQITTYEFELVKFSGAWGPRGEQRKLYLKAHPVSSRLGGLSEPEQVRSVAEELLDLNKASSFRFSMELLLNAAALMRRDAPDRALAEWICEKMALLVGMSYQKWDQENYIQEYGFSIRHAIRILAECLPGSERGIYLDYLLRVDEDALSLMDGAGPECEKEIIKNIQKLAVPEKLDEERRRISDERTRSVVELSAWRERYEEWLHLVQSIAVKAESPEDETWAARVQNNEALNSRIERFYQDYHSDGLVFRNFRIDEALKTKFATDDEYKMVLRQWEYGEAMREHILAPLVQEKTLEDYAPFALYYCAAMESLMNLVLTPVINQALEGEYLTDQWGKKHLFDGKSSYMLGSFVYFLENRTDRFYYESSEDEAASSSALKKVIHRMRELKEIRNCVAHGQKAGDSKEEGCITKKRFERLLGLIGCCDVKSDWIIPNVILSIKGR